MPTLEDELRTAMVEASEHLQLPDGLAKRAWSLGHRPDTAGGPVVRRIGRRPDGAAPQYSRGRLAALAGGLAVVAVVVTAFALGSNNATESGVPATGSPGGLQRQIAAAVPPHGHGAATSTRSGRSASTAPDGFVNDPNASTKFLPRSPASLTGTNGGTASSGNTPSSVTATRVVKDGSMELTVPKGHVQATVDGLVRLVKGLGGYVASSHTNSFAGSPTGDVTLRMPVNKFEDAVSGAQKVGHETSLTTSAHDVTGKFVDLNARLSALQRTRQTYLTILGRATTIGQTLEVQQRVEDVQQQIEQLQGSLKVLRNQSADGTLTVAVSEAGSATAAPTDHQRHGIGKAWHTSVHRFTSGFDAIIAALGPILLALLVLAAIALIGVLGYRGVRRATS